MLGLCCLHNNRGREAVETSRTRAADAKPEASKIHANLGHALRTIGRFDEAAASLERAISLRPNYALAINNLGIVRRAQGRPDEAIACYEKAISLQPNLSMRT